MTDTDQCPLGPDDIDAAEARGDIVALAAAARWLWAQDRRQAHVLATALAIMWHFPAVDDADDYATMRDMLREITLQMADVCGIQADRAC